jgi:aldose 1-epimerase
MDGQAVTFGRALGQTARLFTLANGWLRACITDYAGALVSLEAPDRNGKSDDVVLGFDDVAGYVDNRGSFGALLGRNANRIAGGHIVVDGTCYQLSQNEGRNTLHGGARGLGKRFWQVSDASPIHLTLALTSPDGDQGFPGEVAVMATWRLDETTLSLSFSATTTRPTPLSLSAHPYFNLDGPGACHCLDHEVEIFADAFLPTDAEQIPTGEIRPVAGTPLDLRRRQPIAAQICSPDEQLRLAKGYDHYFVLPPARDGSLRLAARVRAAASGRVLEILTTEPGVQFYTGNNLDGRAAGRGGLYRQSAGLAFEPQGFPNAPNTPNFPTTILRPGDSYHQEIQYRLTTD